MLKGFMPGYMVLGLSRKNLDGLTAGRPIVANIPWPPVLDIPDKVMIFTGLTEEVMETELAKTGLPVIQLRELPHITRTEAEFLVDLIERSGGHLNIAAELREDWGMAPRA